jgi:hypothetical protein
MTSSTFDTVYENNFPDAFKSVFGVDATYTRVSTGAQYQITVMFEEEKTEQIQGYEMVAWKQGDEIEVLLKDIDNVEPDRGDTFLIGSETLTVEKPIKNDGVFCTCEVRA